MKTQILNYWMRETERILLYILPLLYESLLNKSFNEIRYG